MDWLSGIFGGEQEGNTDADTEMDDIERGRKDVSVKRQHLTSRQPSTFSAQKRGYRYCCHHCQFCDGFNECMPCIWREGATINDGNGGDFRCCGLNEDEKMYYEGIFEALYGMLDFISDMVYFSEVVGAKVADSAVGADAMKAFLFLSAIGGIVASVMSGISASEGHDLREKEIPTPAETNRCQTNIDIAGTVVSQTTGNILERARCLPSIPVYPIYVICATIEFCVTNGRSMTNQYVSYSGGLANNISDIVTCKPCVGRPPPCPWEKCGDDGTIDKKCREVERSREVEEWESTLKESTLKHNKSLAKQKKKAYREANFFVFARTCVEDMVQIIITLVIEHYRIQQGQIEYISQVGVANITFSIFGMLYINYKYVRFQEEEDFGLNVFLYLLVCVVNVLPCVITAVVLF